jgi:hypothetical protein
MGGTKLNVRVRAKDAFGCYRDMDTFTVAIPDHDTFNSAFVSNYGLVYGYFTDEHITNPIPKLRSFLKRHFVVEKISIHTSSSRKEYIRNILDVSLHFNSVENYNHWSKTYIRRRRISIILKSRHNER